MADVMAPALGAWRRTRSELALTKRRNPDADTTELRRRMDAERLADRIREVVDAAPPLTDELRAQLATLLRPAELTASVGSPDAAA